MRTKQEILNGEDEKLFLLKCSLSPEIFCERVLGLELKDFHKEWLQILQTYDKIAISAPTGFGKTTIFGVAYPIWQAFFKPRSQSLIISKTIRTQSAGILEEIKRTIEDNEILRQLIPEDNKSYWTKEKINMNNGSCIFYSSYTQSIRGVHVNYLFADEVSTYPESDLYFRDVVSRVVAKKGRIAAVSTPINMGDLLAQLMRNKVYFSKSYPAIVEGVSIWPERFSVNSLMKVKLEQGDSNFEKNYMCNPKAEAENTVFPMQIVMEGFNFDAKFTSDTEGQTYIGCDFAIAKGPTADYDAFLVIDKVKDFFIIKHIETHKGLPVQAKVRRIVQLNEMFKPVRVVIDESGIGNAILEELKSTGMPVLAQSFHSIARNNLLMNMKNIIDGKKLIIPRHQDDSMALRLTDELVIQLIGFREAKSKQTGSINYLSQASHDDIAMALAMALKEATRQKSTSVFMASTS
jgi:hypothetical protein